MKFQPMKTYYRRHGNTGREDWVTCLAVSNVNGKYRYLFVQENIRMFSFDDDSSEADSFEPWPKRGRPSKKDSE